MILIIMASTWIINTKVRKEIREVDVRKKAEAEEYLDLARKIADQDED
jgi:hypothetical protein